MVQIKRKVTLKVKTEQVPVKGMKSTSGPTPNGGESNGKGGSSKIFVFMAAVALAVFLCYGAFSYFSSSDEQSDGPSTEQVAGPFVKSNEEISKDVSNTEKSGIDSANNDESVNDEGVSTPEQEVSSPKVSSPQSDSKQDGTTNTIEPSKTATPASQATTLSGSFDEMVNEVIRGYYGNGEVRKQKLGDQYWEIQKKVNEIYRQKGLL